MKKKRVPMIICPYCKKKTPRSVIIRSGYFMCPKCSGNLPKFNYTSQYKSGKYK